MHLTIIITIRYTLEGFIYQAQANGFTASVMKTEEFQVCLLQDLQAIYPGPGANVYSIIPLSIILTNNYKLTYSVMM